MGGRTLDIVIRNEADQIDAASVERKPFTIQHVFNPQSAAYDFAWDGSQAYLAWHDIVLSDGEMAGDDLPVTRALDLRRRMTFFPQGMRATGWVKQVDRVNSFTALYFDQNWLLDELEIAPKERTLAPSVYFHDRRLAPTMEKLGHLARATASTPRLLADSLVTLAGVELLRALQCRTHAPGSLSPAQLARTKDYIDNHLLEDVSLSNMAAAAELSPFHFARAFKLATGVSPYRYVLEARVERAKTIIRTSPTKMSEVAASSGFSSQSQFSRTFADITGVSPREFKKQIS